MEKIFTYQVTGHDTDFYRCIAPTSYVKIAEMACFEVAERSGMPMQRMIDELRATWMTASFQLEIYKDIFYIGPVDVYVEPYVQNGVLFTETVHIFRDGEKIAKCAMNTMAVDFQTRKVLSPASIAQHFNVPYTVGNGAPARLQMPEDMEFAEDYVIRYSDCDHNQHLRALEYINLVCDTAEYWGTLPRKKGRGLKVEYIGECKAGDTLTLMRKVTPEGVYVMGVRNGEKVSFKAQFIME